MCPFLRSLLALGVACALVSAQTTGAACDVECLLGETCDNLCDQGKLVLPPQPQESPVSSELRAPPSSHLKFGVDTRVLMPGETLVLSPQAGAAVLLTCRSNMAQDHYVLQAGNRLRATLTFSQHSGDTCPSSGPTLPREAIVTTEAGAGEEQEGSIEFPGAQQPPPEGGEWEWSVPVTSRGGGYGVNVSVEEVRLDASRGDLLAINPGLMYDPTRAAVFSWNTKKSEKRELRILGQDSFFVHLVLGPSPNGVKFRLTYTTTDEVTEAPTEPSTTPALPTAPANVSDSIYVFIGGVTPEQFIADLEDFRSSIALQADDFCREKEIPLAEPIQSDNVVVYLVERCPAAWQDQQLCVAVQFAVPAFTEPDNVTGVAPYELTGHHLEEMWGAIVLQKPMTPYTPPGSVLWWWIGLTLAVLLLVLLLILVAWRVDVYHSLSSYKKTSLVGSGSSGRGSGSWEDPLPHQVVPPYLVVDPEQSSKKMPEIYSQDWGYSERSSYSVTGMDNEAYDDEEEIDVFGQRRGQHVDSDEEIVQTIRPITRLDPIYDTPAVTEVKLRDVPSSETVL